MKSTLSDLAEAVQGWRTDDQGSSSYCSYLRYTRLIPGRCCFCVPFVCPRGLLVLKKMFVRFEEMLIAFFKMLM